MKILLINQTFLPGVMATGEYLTELASMEKTEDFTVLPPGGQVMN